MLNGFPAVNSPSLRFRLEWNESRVTFWVTRDAKLIRRTMARKAEEQKAEIMAAGEIPIMSYNQTDFVKDRVAVEVQFGKYAFVAYDLFVKHLAFTFGTRSTWGSKYWR